MIHVFLGTKAQLIKTEPVIRRLDREQVPYRLIDSGQHAEISSALRKELGIREPDVRLREFGSVSSFLDGVLWLLQLLAWGACCPRSVRRRVFADQGGVCLIHGDTATTLVSLYLAKRAGLKVAHLEAGLRSDSLRHPFPEELIRRIAMRWSDVLFAPSEWAMENLQRMGVRGRRVNLGCNTNVEAVRRALELPASLPLPSEPYGVMTIHRLETIYSGRRLRMAVELLRTSAAKRFMVFVVHEPTRRQLNRREWWQTLVRHPRVQLLPLQPHHEFLHLMKHAEFVITDGGSIQEESAYLQVPCLVLRQRTERREGLSANVRLVPFDHRQAEMFLDTYQSLRGTGEPLEATPSAEVLRVLAEYDRDLRGMTEPSGR